MTCEDSTPDDDVGRKVFGDRYTLDDPIRGIFDKDHRNVDTGGQPGELVDISRWTMENPQDARLTCSPLM